MKRFLILLYLVPWLHLDASAAAAADERPQTAVLLTRSGRTIVRFDGSLDVTLPERAVRQELTELGWDPERIDYLLSPETTNDDRYTWILSTSSPLIVGTDADHSTLVASDGQLNPSIHDMRTFFAGLRYAGLSWPEAHACLSAEMSKIRRREWLVRDVLAGLEAARLVASRRVMDPFSNSDLPALDATPLLEHLRHNQLPIVSRTLDDDNSFPLVLSDGRLNLGMSLSDLRADLRAAGLSWLLSHAALSPVLSGDMRVRLMASCPLWATYGVHPRHRPEVPHPLLPVLLEESNPWLVDAPELRIKGRVVIDVTGALSVSDQEARDLLDYCGLDEETVQFLVDPDQTPVVRRMKLDRQKGWAKNRVNNDFTCALKARRHGVIHLGKLCTLIPTFEAIGVPESYLPGLMETLGYYTHGEGAAWVDASPYSSRYGMGGQGGGGERFNDFVGKFRLGQIRVIRGSPFVLE